MSVRHPPIVRPVHRVLHQPLVVDVEVPVGDGRAGVLHLVEHRDIPVKVTSTFNFGHYTTSYMIINNLVPPGAVLLLEMMLWWTLLSYF